MNASTERCGAKSLPEFRIAPGQMLLVFLEGVARRTECTHSGFWHGIVAYVAFATFFLIDILGDVIDLLELPYVISTGPHVQLRQTVRISQRRLIDVASP